MHDSLGQLLSRSSWNISIANGILSQENVIAKLRALSCGCGNAYVCLGGISIVQKGRLE